MSSPKLVCPFGEYRSGMRIYCKVKEIPCGHVRFKSCKGWWVQSPAAAECPLRRRQEHGENETAAGGRG